MSNRERMDYDVVVVGAGPAGLAAAIRLKQLAPDLTVCVLEKAAAIGGHLLSGAVLEPRALTELYPDWQQRGAPLHQPVTADRFLFLTRSHALRLPTPPPMRNHGNYIISIGELAQWLAAQAEALGVEIYPGFAAAEVLYDSDGAVTGVATNPQGVGRDGQPRADFNPGVELRAKQTIFAEGCRGSLSKQLFSRFDLRDGIDPQTYALGLKEVWEIDPARHRPGLVMHSIGWPLDDHTYGGSWLYHDRGNRVSLGFVVGLDYWNPHLSPFQELQRFKLHPVIRSLLAGGRRIAYGARALSEGGLQSLPRLTFPGGLLVGDAAGFLNVPKIKGNHAAMKSGLLAAEGLVAMAGRGGLQGECTDYPELFRASWLHDELYRVRNIRPAFHYGLWPGMAYAAFDHYVLRGKAPWTFRNRADHKMLERASAAPAITYPPPDNVLTFDRLSSVALTNVAHEEDQPGHLRLARPEVAIKLNLALYDSPEQRYCPAGVYEIVRDGAAGTPRLQINASNCIHCKSCDIKDPSQNITWVTPEGGGGPNYSGL